MLPLEGTSTLTIGGDRTVCRLGFGAMRLTGEPAWLDRATAIAIARRAVELGVTFIDTADSYDFGDNEQLLAEALYPYPPGLVIATKGGHVNLGRQWIPLGRPEYLRQQAELSLRRLRLDQIGLYQLHRIDHTVPLADQVGALRLLQDQGKIRHIGLSEVTLDQLTAAGKITPIASVQNRYNLTDRASEDVLRYCEQLGIAFIPWLPVATVATGSVGTMISTIAARLNATPAQIALAWLLHHSPFILPIPGTSSREHLEDNIAAARLSLDRATIAQLACLLLTTRPHQMDRRQQVSGEAGYGQQDGDSEREGDLAGRAAGRRARGGSLAPAGSRRGEGGHEAEEERHQPGGRHEGGDQLFGPAPSRGGPQDQHPGNPAQPARDRAEDDQPRRPYVPATAARRHCPADEPGRAWWVCTVTWKWQPLTLTTISAARMSARLMSLTGVSFLSTAKGARRAPICRRACDRHPESVSRPIWLACRAG